MHIVELYCTFRFENHDKPLTIKLSSGMDERKVEEYVGVHADELRRASAIDIGYGDSPEVSEVAYSRCTEDKSNWYLQIRNHSFWSNTELPYNVNAIGLTLTPIAQK